MQSLQAPLNVQTSLPGSNHQTCPLEIPTYQQGANLSVSTPAYVRTLAASIISCSLPAIVRVGVTCVICNPTVKVRYDWRSPRWYWRWLSLGPILEDARSVMWLRVLNPDNLLVSTIIFNTIKYTHIRLTEPQ